MTKNQTIFKELVKNNYNTQNIYHNIIMLNGLYVNWDSWANLIKTVGADKSI